MKLIFYECKKAVGARRLVVFLLLCTIACGVLCFAEARRDDTYFYLKKIGEDYAADPAAVRAYYDETLSPLSNDFDRLWRAYRRGEIVEEPVRSLPCTYSGDERYDDFQLIGLFFYRQNADHAWRLQIKTMIDTANANKEEILICYTNLDENSFAYRQQDRISALYTEVLDSTPTITSAGYGWDQLFSFDAVNIFIFLSILAGAIGIFLSDVGKASLILRASKNGRGKTALAKITALLCWSALSVILVLLAAGVAVYLKCGAYSDLSAPMASFHDFQFMPYSYSIWEYLLVFLGTKILLALAVSMLCAFVCLLFRSVSLGFLSSAALMAVQFFLFDPAQTDALKYLNCYGIARFGSMTDTFRCVNVFRHAVPILPAVLFLLVLILLLLTAAVFLCFRKFRLANELHFHPFAWLRRTWEQIAPSGRKRMPKAKRHSTGLLSYEFRKTFLTRASVILLFLVLALKIGIASAQYERKDGYRRTLYQEYIQQLSGENTDEKREFIESEYAYITETLARESQVRADLLQGRIEPEAYTAFLSEYHDAYDREDLITRLREHSAYLDETEKRAGVSAHYLFDPDWIRLFQAGADTILMAYLVYTFSGVFADESAGAFALVRSTKKGRETLFRRKLLFTALSSFLITGVFILIDAVLIRRGLDLPGGASPLLSLELFGKASVSLSIREMLILSALLKMTAALFLSLISAVTGALIKHKLYTLVATFSAAFLPEILSAFGVKRAAYFSFARAFQRSDLLRIGSSLQIFGDWGYAVLFFLIAALITAALTVAAKKEVCQ